MDDALKCPKCSDELDITDRHFRPCKCGFQLCSFCFNNISQGNNCCPSCHAVYKKENFIFSTPSPQEREYERLHHSKKNREREKRNNEMNARQKLNDMRVIQRNLIYVTNLPVYVAKEEVLRHNDYFGRFGTISKVVVKKNGATNGQEPFLSAYLTFTRKQDAFSAIKAVDGTTIGGKVLHVAFGTTKYCSFFLRSTKCPNVDCVYLHYIGGEGDSFTKEDMIQGKHYSSKLSLEPQMGKGPLLSDADPPLSASSPEVRSPPVPVPTNLALSAGSAKPPNLNNNNEASFARRISNSNSKLSNGYTNMPKDHAEPLRNYNQSQFLNQSQNHNSTNYIPNNHNPSNHLNSRATHHHYQQPYPSLQQQQQMQFQQHSQYRNYNQGQYHSSPPLPQSSQPASYPSQPVQNAQPAPKQPQKDLYPHNKNLKKQNIEWRQTEKSKPLTDLTAPTPNPAQSVPSDATSNPPKPALTLLQTASSPNPSANTNLLSTSKPAPPSSTIDCTSAPIQIVETPCNSTSHNSNKKQEEAHRDRSQTSLASPRAVTSASDVVVSGLNPNGRASALAKSSDAVTSDDKMGSYFDTFFMSKKTLSPDAKKSAASDVLNVPQAVAGGGAVSDLKNSGRGVFRSLDGELQAAGTGQKDRATSGGNNSSSSNALCLNAKGDFEHMLDSCWEVGGVQKPFSELPVSLSPKRSRFDFARENQQPLTAPTAPSSVQANDVTPAPNSTVNGGESNSSPCNNAPSRANQAPISSFNAPPSTLIASAFPGPPLTPPLITLLPQLQVQPAPVLPSSKAQQPLAANAKTHSMNQLFNSPQSQPAFFSEFIASNYSEAGVDRGSNPSNNNIFLQRSNFNRDDSHNGSFLNLSAVGYSNQFVSPANIASGFNTSGRAFYENHKVIANDQKSKNSSLGKVDDWESYDSLLNPQNY